MHPDLVQFVHVLPEPSFLVSGNGGILYANSAAAELAGVDRRTLASLAFGALIADPPEKVQEYLKLCARSRELLPGSFAWPINGGPRQDIRCDGAAIVPRTDSEPAVLFIRCRSKAESIDRFDLLNQKIASLSKEIIDRKKAEQQRDELLKSERAARVEAERNSRMKDEFLSTLSHELRTPLNAILGWSQLLCMEPSITSGVTEGLRVIERNALIQKQLIEDLLDMSRIISGKVRMDVQRVTLAPVIEAAVASVRPATEAKGIRLQVTLDPIAGPVKGDPNRLQQVVWNLLSNAIKFTPKGGRVQVFLERVNSHVEIIVSDTGEGIKPEFLAHVFDRFRQEDASTTRRHGGLGLGLSIVKQLVELHGGSVRAKSPGVGQGATFAVMLPLLVLHEEEDLGLQQGSRVHPGRTAEGTELCESAALTGIKVLVVDDEPDTRELVRRLLQGCKAEVVTAASAEEALVALENHSPDVLISDIGMPQVDGYELIRRVRAKPASQGGRIPAIALTAFARTEDRTRAMLAGFTVHLSKPIDAAELIATVASLAGLTSN